MSKAEVNFCSNCEYYLKEEKTYHLCSKVPADNYFIIGPNFMEYKKCEDVRGLNPQLCPFHKEKEDESN